MLVSYLKNPRENFLDFIRMISESKSIEYDNGVAQSEKDNDFRNSALTNFLKSFGNIDNNIEEVLDFYFNQCSIEMKCQELAHSFFFLANEGKTKEGNKILTKSQVKRLSVLMQTCGFYDESGEFTHKVGLQGKSGVGGGIVALYPNVFVVATWSKLNTKDNAGLRIHALEASMTSTGMSVFFKKKSS